MERLGTDIADLLAFARVVETGSFARAAERLGQSKSIVSRRVARLEQSLGTPLLVRTARGTQPTELGSAYYVRAMAALAELEAARESVAHAVSDIAGPLRLTAPLSFGVSHVAPVLAEFARRYPRVELDVSFDDHTVDLAAGGYDLAIRIGTLADSSLIARRIAPLRRALVGSADYLGRQGWPTCPADLARHDLLFYANGSNADWRFQRNGVWEQARGRPHLRADNGDMLRDAACAGLGLAVLPLFICGPALRDGRLERVLPDYGLAEVTLNAVTLPGRNRIARIRALLDFLGERLANLDDGPAAG